MMQVSFSVIIPLYNKAPFITRAIDSVLSQTYSDFEIIVVDDGSKDGSGEIVKAIRSDKVKLINQPNAGVSAARNKGVSLAKYPYIAFLDADDIWDKDFLLEIIKLIYIYPSAGIYGSNNYFLYPNGNRIENDVGSLFPDQDYGIILDYFKVFADIQRSPFSNSNIVIPAKIYNELGGYKVGVRLTEDSDLWCRIALKYDIAFTKMPLSTYCLGLKGSTHLIFEDTDKDFEVARTLKKALKENRVPVEKIESVKRLLSLQKINLIKRGILTNNKTKILTSFFNFLLLIHYPLEYFKCIVSLLLPYSVINRKKK